MTDGKAGGATGEAAISEQRAFGTEAHGFEVAGRIEHFLHARPAFRPFVANNDNVARFDFAFENTVHGGVLAFVNDSFAAECVDACVHSGGFNDAAVFGDVAVEDGKAAVLRVGVVNVADAAIRAVIIHAVVTAVLREGSLAAQSGGACLVEFTNFRGRVAGQVVAVNGVLQGCTVHGWHVGTDEACAREFGEDVHDAASAVHVFDVVFGLVRRNFAQLRDAARQGINVFHRVGDVRFLRGGEQVQNGVGRAAHGDIEGHGILEGVEVGDGARQDAGIAFAVVALGDGDDGARGIQEELFAIGMGGEGSAVTGQ